MFEIGELAGDSIKERLQAVKRPELALRVEIVARSEDEFHYRMSFVPPELSRPVAPIESRRCTQGNLL